MDAPAVGDRYRIVKALGAGAAGEVWLVENLRAERLEALKILKNAGQDHADRVAKGRFKREVRASQLLSHENIVATYDCGELPDGRMYLTMEYVDGASLYTVVQQRGPLPIALVLGIMAEVAEAIHHAHLSGVVHRDLKPHNIVLADHPDGKIVRVLDFGMAKILRGVEESMVLSADGAIFGTPAYMAPEQCQGKPPDMRSDIYALGCVAFELLIGDPPFRGHLARLLAMQLTQPPPVPSSADPEAGIPRELDALVLRCLEKDPAARFQTGGALSAAVQAIPGYRPLRVSNHEG